MALGSSVIECIGIGGGQKMNAYSQSLKRKRFLPIVRLFVCIAMLTMLLTSTGCFHTGPDVRTWISVTSVDFAPEDGDYDLNWPGPPRRAWTEKDKEYYQATIKLDQPAPEDFDLFFYVKENKWWSDPVLSLFPFHFFQGATTAQQRFWLVCTRKGRVKGSFGKGDDSHATVYLESSGLASNVDLDTWGWHMNAKRREHDCRCE